MARRDVLSDGFVDVDGGVTPGSNRVGSTVSLIHGGDLVAIVDPAMVTSRAAILDPLATFGVTVDDVTDVIISHHHPDHGNAYGVPWQFAARTATLSQS